MIVSMISPKNCPIEEVPKMFYSSRALFLWLRIRTNVILAIIHTKVGLASRRQMNGKANESGALSDHKYFFSYFGQCFLGNFNVGLFLILLGEHKCWVGFYSKIMKFSIFFIWITKKMYDEPWPISRSKHLNILFQQQSILVSQTLEMDYASSCAATSTICSSPATISIRESQLKCPMCQQYFVKVCQLGLFISC